MLKKVKKGFAISVGLASIAKKRVEKELRKRGVNRKIIKNTVKKIGGIALREGRRVENLLKKEIANEIKKAKPGLKKIAKKGVKTAKKKAKKVLRKVSKKRR